ncbi:MAG TPA: hypothetical protein VLA59_05835 [Patescibacteria group bacterium]|nr:hypothetical protein [Patescibacteria group bacterium]
MRILRLVSLALLALVLAGCAGPAPADLIPVPTSAPTGLIGPTACPAALLEGELVADDQFGFVVAHADGFTSAVTWPHGYVARDAPRRELLDDSGRVVAREGDLVALGGGEGTAGPGFIVCRQLDVTPVP